MEAYNRASVSPFSLLVAKRNQTCKASGTGRFVSGYLSKPPLVAKRCLQKLMYFIITKGQLHLSKWKRDVIELHFIYLPSNRAPVCIFKICFMDERTQSWSGSLGTILRIQTLVCTTISCQFYPKKMKAADTLFFFWF